MGRGILLGEVRAPSRRAEPLARLAHQRCLQARKRPEADRAHQRGLSQGGAGFPRQGQGWIRCTQGWSDIPNIGKRNGQRLRPLEANSAANGDISAADQPLCNRPAARPTRALFWDHHSKAFLRRRNLRRSRKRRRCSPHCPHKPIIESGDFRCCEGFRMPAALRDGGCNGGRRPKASKGGNRGGQRKAAPSALWGFRRRARCWGLMAKRCRGTGVDQAPNEWRWQPDMRVRCTVPDGGPAMRTNAFGGL